MTRDELRQASSLSDHLRAVEESLRILKETRQVSTELKLSVSQTYGSNPATATCTVTITYLIKALEEERSATVTQLQQLNVDVA